MNHFAEIMAPVLASMIFFSVPIAIIFTKHQQKMALLLRGPVGSNTDQVAKQMQELQYLIFQQSAAIEELSTAVKRLETASAPELASRLQHS